MGDGAPASCSPAGLSAATHERRAPGSVELVFRVFFRPIFFFLRAYAVTAQRWSARVFLRLVCGRKPTPCDVLVVGSSVAAGVGAAGGQGWAQQLAVQLGPRASFINEAVPGSNTWSATLLLKASLLRWRPRVIVLCFNVGNDGLMLTRRKWQANAVANGFLRALPMIVSRAEQAGARVILTSSYPHSGYQAVHAPALRRVHDVTSCMACERFVDFHTVLDDGCGRWRAAECADPAHPNDLGHCQMLKVARPAVEAVIEKLRADRRAL